MGVGEYDASKYSHTETLDLPSTVAAPETNQPFRCGSTTQVISFPFLSSARRLPETMVDGWQLLKTSIAPKKRSQKNHTDTHETYTDTNPSTAT